jgi:hypothetical protein
MRKFNKLFFLFIVLFFSSYVLADMAYAQISLSPEESKVYTNEDIERYKSGNWYVPQQGNYNDPLYQEPNLQPERRDSRKDETLNRIEERIKELELKLNSSLLKPDERDSMNDELKELYRQRTNLLLY